MVRRSITFGGIRATKKSVEPAVDSDGKGNGQPAKVAKIEVPEGLPAVSARSAPATQRSPNAAEIRRARLRAEEFGEDAGKRIWHKGEAGFCTIPRYLSLLCTLIRHLTKGADAARVYADLWERQYEDGFVEIYDEEDIAVACGYRGGHRGIRYWREAMTELVRLGFVEVKGKNTRKYGYVLLPHPLDVVKALQENKKIAFPSGWETVFQRRLHEVGAKPRAKPKPETAPEKKKG